MFMVPWLVIEITMGVIALTVMAVIYGPILAGAAIFVDVTHRDPSLVEAVTGIDKAAKAESDAGLAIVVGLGLVLLLVIAVKIHLINVVACYRIQLDERLEQKRFMAASDPGPMAVDVDDKIELLGTC